MMISSTMKIFLFPILDSYKRLIGLMILLMRKKLQASKQAPLQLHTCQTESDTCVFLTQIP